MAKKKNPEETVKNILNTAMHLFKEKGFENTSILDIVEKMGVSRGAFYHHFKSKEEVLYALLESKSNKEYEQSIYDNPSINGLDKIRKLMYYTGVKLDKEDHQEGCLLLNMWLGLLEDPRFMSEHLNECKTEDISWMVPLLLDAMRDGSVRQQNATLLAELILLLLNFWLIPTIYPIQDLALFIEKTKLAKSILDDLGCPLVNDEVLALLQEMAVSYEKSKKEP